MESWASCTAACERFSLPALPEEVTVISCCAAAAELHAAASLRESQNEVHDVESPQVCGSEDCRYSRSPDRSRWSVVPCYLPPKYRFMSCCAVPRARSNASLARL